jgi:hypothetical protein
MSDQLFYLSIKMNEDSSDYENALVNTMDALSPYKEQLTFSQEDGSSAEQVPLSFHFDFSGFGSDAENAPANISAASCEVSADIKNGDTEAAKFKCPHPNNIMFGAYTMVSLYINISVFFE